MRPNSAHRERRLSVPAPRTAEQHGNDGAVAQAAVMSGAFTNARPGGQSRRQRSVVRRRASRRRTRCSRAAAPSRASCAVDGRSHAIESRSHRARCQGATLSPHRAPGQARGTPATGNERRRWTAFLKGAALPLAGWWRAQSMRSLPINPVGTLSGRTARCSLSRCGCSIVADLTGIIAGPCAGPEACSPVRPTPVSRWCQRRAGQPRERLPGCPFRPVQRWQYRLPAGCVAQSCATSLAS